MTPSGIEPATFRFVEQHLNHCATAVPSLNLYRVQIIVGIILNVFHHLLPNRLVTQFTTLITCSLGEVKRLEREAEHSLHVVRGVLPRAPICLHIVHMGSSTLDSLFFLVCEVSIVTTTAAAHFCGVVLVLLAEGPFLSAPQNCGSGTATRATSLEDGRV